jgi:predicted nucleic acid-binding protein
MTQYEDAGTKAHDARLVAFMMVHGLDTIVTFNVEDFKRYKAIAVAHPCDFR